MSSLQLEPDTQKGANAMWGGTDLASGFMGRDSPDLRADAAEHATKPPDDHQVTCATPLSRRVTVRVGRVRARAARSRARRAEAREPAAAATARAAGRQPTAQPPVRPRPTPPTPTCRALPPALRASPLSPAQAAPPSPGGEDFDKFVTGMAEGLGLDDDDSAPAPSQASRPLPDALSQASRALLSSARKARYMPLVPGMLLIALFAPAAGETWPGMVEQWRHAQQALGIHPSRPLQANSSLSNFLGTRERPGFYHAVAHNSQTCHSRFRGVKLIYVQNYKVNTQGICELSSRVQGP